MLKKKTKIVQGSEYSIRTTIPTDIAALMDVGIGDSVEWVVHITPKGVCVQVQKAN